MFPLWVVQVFLSSGTRVPSFETESEQERDATFGFVTLARPVEAWAVLEQDAADLAFPRVAEEAVLENLPPAGSIEAAQVSEPD